MSHITKGMSQIHKIKSGYSVVNVIKYFINKSRAVVKAKEYSYLRFKENLNTVGSRRFLDDCKKIFLALWILNLITFWFIQVKGGRSLNIKEQCSSITVYLSVR